MTATRASQSAAPPGNETDDYAVRSAFGPYGIPLWGAVLAAAVPTAIGTLVDILIWQQPGVLFKVCFFLGSLAAVLMVKRANVFGPMVQPPLVLGVVMPLLVLITGAGSGGGGGLAGQALAIARPLITSFPIMAGAAAVSLGIGLIRIFVTEKAPATSLDLDAIDPEAKTRKQRPVPPPKKAPAKKPASRSPEREAREAPKSRKSAAEARKPRGESPTRGGAQPRGAAQPRGEGRPKPPAGRSGGGAAPRQNPGGRPRPAEQRGAQPPRRGPAPRQNPGGRPRPPEPPPGGQPRRPR